MPARSILSDREFVQAWIELGPARMSRQYGIVERALQNRRRRLENRGIVFHAPSDRPEVRVVVATYPWQADLSIRNGTVIIASDAHYWPGNPSLMHRALVYFCKELKPRAMIYNGDVIDAVTIKRFPPIGWEGNPQLADEIEAAKERLHEIEKAAFKAEKIWTLGNHDARFETRLASVAPEYAKIHGVHLKDHFPLWRTAWSAWINNDVVVKHRFKGGVNAPRNNTIYAGKTMITGHLHSAQVIPFSDYNGTRYGVDSGCIADTDHKAFVDYTEANPLNWRSAF